MPTFLTVDHHYTRVDTDNHGVMRLVRSLLTYTPRGSAYRRVKKVPSLFENGKFPTGHLSTLQRALDENNVLHTLNDLRKPPEYTQPNLNLDGIEFRPYQKEGIAFGLNIQCGVFHWPPGTGKTELLLGLLNSLRLPTLWLVPTRNVLAQTVERIGKRTALYGLTNVVIPQGIWKRHKGTDYFDKYKLLIIDECHHTGADTWYKVAMSCPAEYRFGTSATPDSTQESELKLSAAVSTMQHRMSYADCYAENWLSRPQVRMMHYISPTVVHPNRVIRTHTGNRVVAQWDKLYEQGIVNNTTRNRLAVDEAIRYLQAGYSPLIITRYVEDHAYPMMELCEKAGLKTGVITGESSTDTRIEEIDKLLNGELQVLVSSCILGEGQDMPDLSAVINLVGGDSERQTIQITGRVMRPASPAFVTDFIDSNNGILARHSRRRRKAYESIGADVRIVKL